MASSVWVEVNISEVILAVRGQRHLVQIAWYGISRPFRLAGVSYTKEVRNHRCLSALKRCYEGTR